MEKKKFLTISLSQEEVFVVLAHMGMRQMLGIDGGIFQSLTKEQVELAFTVAERALIARGFLKPGEDAKLQIDPVVLSIFATCTVPDTSLIITRSEPEMAAIAFFFHLTKQLQVGHTSPASGIHQFTVYAEKTAVSNIIHNILQLDSQEKLPCPSGELAETAVTQARDAAVDSGMEGALAVLQQTDLADETQKQFAQTLSSPKANTTFVHINHKIDKDNQADGFTVLEGINGLWILKPASGDDVSLQPVSAAEAEQLFQALNE
ncbi:MAG: hypothetical protein H6662_06320 [Ardenticatenaceae bacterium]|nr:hypothetical protein [Anaerolineales bacterium]MCB8921180.1 hypothetical protein [Ardenticatenaceae bacterium]MCB8990882.1 hypothetical protein [Ardenticatenaceae bacterium]